MGSAPFFHLLRKAARAPRNFNILSCNRATAACNFSDIWTYKSGEGMVCFAPVDLKMRFAPQRRAIFPHTSNLVFNILICICASSHKCLPFLDTWTSKSDKRMVCFVHLTSKCASRHSRMPFFDIWTSKSGEIMVCFVHVDCKMRLAPQRCAIFHVSSGHMASHPPL